MPDFLGKAADWLAGVRRAALARSVTYRRGAYSVTLLATVGSTEFASNEDSNMTVEFDSRDFILEANDLVLNEAFVEPKSGDRITDDGKIYEVLPQRGGRAFRYSDHGLKTIRVHTKQVGPAV